MSELNGAGGISAFVLLEYKLNEVADQGSPLDNQGMFPWFLVSDLLESISKILTYRSEFLSKPI